MNRRISFSKWNSGSLRGKLNGYPITKLNGTGGECLVEFRLCKVKPYTNPYLDGTIDEINAGIPKELAKYLNVIKCNDGKNRYFDIMSYNKFSRNNEIIRKSAPLVDMTINPWCDAAKYAVPKSKENGYATIMCSVKDDAEIELVY